MSKKIIFVFCFITIFFLLGLGFAYFQAKSKVVTTTVFHPEAVVSGDKIILVSKGDIYQMTHDDSKQITYGKNLIEPVAVGNNFVAIEKKTNYSSMLMLDEHGNNIKTLFSGNNDKIDNMNWIGDPVVNASKTKIAYVSDKDRAQINMPDNALYVFNLSTGRSTNIAKPDPYSGGIAHPIFDPGNENIILYDYYQYDPQTLMPYSTIQQYDNTTGLLKTLTLENKNAYQGVFSPDGKRLLFLGRNDGLNTVTLYIADFDSNLGLSNIQPMLSGDLAYPEFSHANDHIYFLQAQENSGYDLVSATIRKNNIINTRSVVSNNTLQGNSSYTVISSE